MYFFLSMHVLKYVSFANTCKPCIFLSWSLRCWHTCTLNVLCGWCTYLWSLVKKDLFYGVKNTKKWSLYNILPFSFWFLMLYWSLQGKVAQFTMFKSIFEVKALVVWWLDSMRTFNIGLQLYRWQFPCMLCVASIKSFLSSCGLYNVLEKPLTEGECELSFQIYSSIEGKEGKNLIFLRHTLSQPL